MTMQGLIERLEKATRADRILADDVLFACGWRICYSKEQVAEARSQGAEAYADLADNGCWYPPDTLVDAINAEIGNLKFKPC